MRVQRPEGRLGGGANPAAPILSAVPDTGPATPDKAHEQLVRALVVLRAALGAVVWTAPRTTTRLLGIEHTAPSQAALLARVFAVRDVALAYGLGASGPGSRRLWLRAGMASDVGDAVAGLLAARRRDVPRPVGALLVASGIAALAAAAAAIRSEPPAG